MKRVTIGVVSIVVVATLVLGFLPAMAAKPPDKGKPLDVIERSNGFPSGPHFNLNMHGRPCDWTGDPDPGGKSLFIGLSGNSTIEYVSNKKSSATDLYAIDPLAECFAPDYDPARVFLPYKIDDGNGGTIDAQGYYVFGRILGSPNKGSQGESRILIWPTFVVQSCNCTGDPDDFGDLRDCLDAEGDLALGLITSSGNLYGAQQEEFVRFPDPEPEKGKGKSKAKEITQLFKWSGYVTDNTSLDTSGPYGDPDGYLDEHDVPIIWDTPGDPYNGNGNGIIDEFELINWLDYLVSIGEAIKYTDKWIFDIADLVIAGQTVTNDGTKLFQVRFYPVATTFFESEYMP